MRKRDACFTCTTPYQLMGAISIVQNIRMSADLYLFGTFHGSEEVARRLEKYKIFADVIFVKSNPNRNISRLKILWQIINRRNVVKKFLSSDLVYDSFFSTSKTHGKLLLLYELRRRNPQMKYVIYEDGIGSYNKYAHQLNDSRYTRLFEIIAFSKVFIPERTSIMVRYPNLLQLPDALNGIPQNKMPFFNICRENVKMLQDIYNIHENELISEKIILFDTGRGVYRKDSFNLDLIDKCFELVSDTFLNSNIILKAHPKSTEKIKLNINSYSRSDVPVEVLYTSMPDLEDRILIGNHTTALYTPKMLFNKEPIVISLHKIAWQSKPYLTAVFDKIVSMYDHKDRIVAPDSIEALKNYLKNISNYAK